MLLRAADPAIDSNNCARRPLPAAIAIDWGSLAAELTDAAAAFEPLRARCDATSSQLQWKNGRSGADLEPARCIAAHRAGIVAESHAKLVFARDGFKQIDRLRAARAIGRDRDAKPADDRRENSLRPWRRMSTCSRPRSWR